MPYIQRNGTALGEKLQLDCYALQSSKFYNKGSALNLRIKTDKLRSIFEFLKSFAPMLICEKYILGLDQKEPCSRS